MLREHPRIQMARVKEVHFFDNEAINWRAPDFESLHCHFDWNKKGVVRGEATPIYIYWPKALTRLRNYNPYARVIIGLRHPILRAYSQWRMETTRSAETLSFSNAIRAGRERVKAQPQGAHRVFSYIERGFYDLQIRHLKALFPQSQLLFFRTDSLWRDAGRELARIEKFLGLEAHLAPPQKYIAPMQSAPAAEIDGSDVRYLQSLFGPTISALEELTGLTFDDWKSPSYVEPMSPDK